MTSLTKSPDGTLNAQDELFIISYLSHFDPAKAWLDANPGSKANPKYATQYASKLLKKPIIRDRLKELAAQKIEKADVQADRLIAELERIAFLDPLDFMTIDDSGEPVLDLTAMTPENRRLLNIEFGIGVTKDGDRVRTYKVKPRDPDEAIERLLKLHQLYKGEDLQKQAMAIQVNVNFPLPASNWRDNQADQPDVVDTEDL